MLTKWTELRAAVEALDFDVQKNARGVVAAGVRVRKGLRDLKAKASDLVKTTTTRDKAVKAEKATAK